MKVLLDHATVDVLKDAEGQLTVKLEIRYTDSITPCLLPDETDLALAAAKRLLLDLWNSLYGEVYRALATGASNEWAQAVIDAERHIANEKLWTLIEENETYKEMQGELDS